MQTDSEGEADRETESKGGAEVSTTGSRWPETERDQNRKAWRTEEGGREKERERERKRW